jgi:exodeoxyribonuclease VII large subunit
MAITDYLTLSQLAGVIRLAVTQHTGDYWVVAEIAQLSVNRKSGHCYLELMEKEEDRTLARMKGVIWAGDFKSLAAEFREKTGRDLEAGMKILMLARPSFHEVYGLSLNVRDIDPAYTLGEAALRRKETIERLRKEGVIDLNRGLPLPPVLQRIAVVSSGTAAGYGDFLSRLTGSAYGYGFSLTLFEAYMQGTRAERSILSALERCRRKADKYDALALIRGGGSQADLQCFDSYPLARAIATFPLPVLTGIGHERDETVADRAAHRRLITPTAAAEFILTRTRGFEEAVEGLSSRLVKYAERLIGDERNSLQTRGALLSSALRNFLASEKHGLSALARRFEHSVIRELADRGSSMERLAVSLTIRLQAYLSGQLKALRNLDARARLLDPRNVLRRGYSITTLGGRPVTDASALKRGDIIDTRLYSGTVTSSVENIREGGEDGSQKKT